MNRVALAASVADVVPPRPEVIETCLASLILEQRIGEDGVSRLRRYLSGWLAEIRRIHQQRALVHGDFNNRNTLLKAHPR
jgi:hypothetical protein